MIDAKNLMIGNWAWIDTELPFLQHHQIMAQDIVDIYSGITGEYQFEIKPIPLTDKILEKSGFVCYSEYSRYWFIQPELENIHYRLFNIPLTEQWILSKGFFNYNHELRTIKFLHELQNCLWIIADLEINIKL